MDIDILLEELDNAEVHHSNQERPSSSCQTFSSMRKPETELNHGSNGTASANIASLLEDLDGAIFDDNDDAFSSMCEGNTTTPVREKETAAKLESDGVDEDIKVAKKESNSKYSASGYEIHKNLKENRSNTNGFSGARRSWKSKAVPEKTSQLAVSTTVVTGKVDVYAEPIFGLRLVNPVVSSQFIQSKMTGKQPVGVSNIAYHLRCGDRNVDWVFAGAIVFKSGLKTSQKGSQYCTWKVSDLKGDLQTVSVYLFSKACSELWKVAVGTVVAILNATPFNKDEQVSKDDLTLTVRNEDQVMIWGGSRDYGICRAKKKNGDNCTSFVNKSACEFCVYHVKTEYNKFSNRRTDLNFSSSGGTNALRNKVLGKNEVFYGGKSFSALKPPPRDNKVRKRDNQLLKKLPLQAPPKSALLSRFDSQKLEQFKEPRPEERSVEVRNENVDVRNIPNKPENSVNHSPAETVSNNAKKSFASRLHMLREAGQRMIDTGETTRVTLVKPVKKTGGVSFATVFNASESVTPSAAELESRVKKVVTPSVSLRKTPSTSMDFELHIESAPPGAKLNPIEAISGCKKQQSGLQNTRSRTNGADFESKTKPTVHRTSDRNYDIELHIEPPASEKRLKFSHDVAVSSPKNASTSTTATRNTTPRNSSTFLSKFSNLTDAIKSSISSASGEKNDETTPSPVARKSSVSLPTDKEIMARKSGLANVNQDSNSSSAMGNFRMPANSLRDRSSSAASARIHERKKNIQKMKAINMIKNKGGLAKSNPNQVKPDLEKKMSLKRRLEEEEEQDEPELASGETVANKKSVLSQRFIDLMNARSKHEDLVDVAELVEQQNYFNKLEKKEQLEEKMLSTYKVPCKAVTCLKCKYKWFSASDLCRADGHPIKVIDTFKRFFMCDNCKNRTVSLEIIPLTNCRNCGSGKWSRAPMIRDKIVKPENHLCIRGDEQKNLNSLAGSVNLNLLVPD